MVRGFHINIASFLKRSQQQHYGARYAEDQEGTDSRSDEATEESESEDDGPVEANVTVDGSPLGGEKRKGKKSE